MLYNEAQIGELRSIMVTCKYYQIPLKKKNIPHEENILQYYKIVVQIHDSVCWFIYTA